MSDTDAHQRRVEREIAIFEGQDALHQHHASFNWRNERFLRPRLLAAFGSGDVHEIYARAIAAAVARTGAAAVYSLGCGDGEQELEVLRKADALGLAPFAIQGLDLAPAVVARANAAAEACGLAARFRALACEINEGLPSEEPVAAVMVHHALHHFVALEPILDSVAARLHPNGVLVTFDMIGRNGHRRWPEVLPLVAELWEMLPDAKRHDSLFGPTRSFFQDWD
jgi:SAM-dependent methyltransferase